MASPYPKPTVLKVLEGNPGKRPLPKREPSQEPLLPREAGRYYPKDFDALKRYWWRYFFRQFSLPRMLTELHLPMLRLLTIDWVRLLEAQKMLDKTGPIYVHKKKRKVGKDDQGNPIFEESNFPMRMPTFDIERTLGASVEKKLNWFGGSPSMQSSVSTVGPSAADAIEDALA